MSIAIEQVEALGARVFLPEGPYGAAGQTPLPAFKPGFVVGGDFGGEFEFVFLTVVGSLTLNQGDVLIYDNSFQAVQSQTGTGVHPFGASLGTFWLGGRVGDPAAAPAAQNYWSYTFPTPGVYGIWVQRAGISLANFASVSAQTKPVNTTAVNSQLNQPSSPLVGSMGITGMWSCPTSWTFTGTTTNGSVNFTAVSQAKGLVKGQLLSGTGVATGSVIVDTQGSVIVSSLPATASGTVTITASNNAAYVTTTSGSAVLTNVTDIAGIYPNQAISGTGIPGSTTILSITGNSAPYTITMSANATATANNILIATSGYQEAFLQWPYVQTQN